MWVNGLSESDAQVIAQDAVYVCKEMAPKLSGKSSRNLIPVWGEGFFGVKWLDFYVWFQENGINPFTMTKLAGKTIPMWINDPTGEESKKNPKAKTRTTEDGRRQILIFRKAAPVGSRKMVMREGRPVDVPRSYPGAPGRINRRQEAGTVIQGARVGGRIAQYNVGVRWRHPGLSRRGFIRQGLERTAQYHNIPIGPIRDNLGRYR
jgi:hypothetical protein